MQFNKSLTTLNNLCEFLYRETNISDFSNIIFKPESWAIFINFTNINYSQDVKGLVIRYSFEDNDDYLYESSIVFIKLLDSFGQFYDSEYCDYNLECSYDISDFSQKTELVTKISELAKKFIPFNHRTNFMDFLQRAWKYHEIFEKIGSLYYKPNSSNIHIIFKNVKNSSDISGMEISIPQCIARNQVSSSFHIYLSLIDKYDKTRFDDILGYTVKREYIASSIEESKMIVDEINRVAKIVCNISVKDDYKINLCFDDKVTDVLTVGKIMIMFALVLAMISFALMIMVVLSIKLENTK